MGAFANLQARLSLNTSDFSASLHRASAQLKTWSAGLNDSYKKANASLRSHNLDLKDTARIVQGIAVSQAFYQIARSISDATNALWEFNKSLDYTQVTYSALFGSADLAKDFTAVLQEHAVNTIFEYQQLEAASKKLLAYGIEYKNLMFIMKGLTNLGAMSGDAAALDRISLALGQIQSTGYLAATEMRQLANAYVPIYDIIQESFGLTGDQMRRVGDLRLPAHEVINEIVDYANENFGGVGQAAMATITGLENRVLDTLKVLGAAAIRPLATGYKSFLNFFATNLESLREAFTAGGLGGVFEAFVPDKSTQTLIRQFIANVRNMLMSLASVLTVVGQVAGNFAYVFATAFNTFTPVILPVINHLAYFLHTALETRAGVVALRAALLVAAAAFTVLRVQALGAVTIVAVKNVIDALSRSLLVLSTIIVKHPIFSLLALLGVGLVGMSVSSEKANKSISELFNKIAGFSGVKQEDVLQKIPQDITDGTKAAEQFNKRLGEGKEAAEGLEDAVNGTGKAAKKASGLLSFDEVFKLNEPKDTAAGGALGAIDDTLNGMSGLGANLSDLLMPTIPDFSEYISNFTDGLFGGLKDSILTKLGIAGLGALLMKTILDSLKKVITADAFGTTALLFAKAIATALMGAFIGYGFDAVASLITSKLWEALEKAFKLHESSSDNAKLGATIGSSIGGAIGMLVGGLPGSLIGAAIGHLAGGIVGLFWEETKGAFSNTATLGIAGMLGAIAKHFGGALKDLPGLFSASTFSGFFKNLAFAFKDTGWKALAKGGLISAAIGFVVDLIASSFWEYLANAFNLQDGALKTAKIGQTIGSVIGTILGGLLGGPVGAVIGSAIGTFAAGFVGLFWDKITAAFPNATGVFSGIADNIINPIKQAFTEQDWGALGMNVILGLLKGLKLPTELAFSFIGDAVTAIIGGFKQLFGIHSPATTMIPVGENVTLGLLEGIIKAVPRLLKSIGSFADEVAGAFGAWLTATGEAFDNWTTDVKYKFDTWVADTKFNFEVWSADTMASFETWASETAHKFENWKEDVKRKFDLWSSETKQKFDAWKTETKQKFDGWISETKQKFDGWVADTKQKFISWAAETKQKFDGWASDTNQRFSAWVSETKQKLITWTTETKQNFIAWANEAKQKLDGWIADTKQKFVGWAAETKQKIVGWATETKQQLTSWSTETTQRIGTWASENISKFSSWASETLRTISKWVTDAVNKIDDFFDLDTDFDDFFEYTLDGIKDWAKDIWSNVKSYFNKAIDKIEDFLNLSDEVDSDSGRSYSSYSGTRASNNTAYYTGHATGGIFNREHIARFAEGNKAEAIIPLENASAMQPFVDAISQGLLEGLAPTLLQMGKNSSELPPMYVGTLIADERGLKQLSKKLEIIQLQENARRGLVT